KVGAVVGDVKPQAHGAGFTVRGIHLSQSRHARANCEPVRHAPEAARYPGALVIVRGRLPYRLRIVTIALSTVQSRAAASARTHYSGLDGLRALAVVAVIVYHLFGSALPG